MKPKDRITDSIVDNIIQNRQRGKVTVESKGLLHLLTSSKSRILVMIVLTALGLLAFIISFSINVINDVILYDTSYHINEQGTFNPKKSLNSEYALFLFNTAEVWANPGIQIHNGDIIRINISGGFNASVKEVIYGAQNNTQPMYSWVYIGSKNLFDTKPDSIDEGSLMNCLSRNHTHKMYSNDSIILDNYGTILYTIRPESSDIINHPFNMDTSEIRVWNTGNLKKTYDGDRSFHTIDESGYLYFAVNDLVFDDIFDSIGNVQISADSTIKSYYQINTKKTDVVRKDHSYAYRDNMGQLLVSVEIMHHISMFQKFCKPMSTKVFCEFYELGTQLLNSDSDNTKKSVLQFIAECIRLLFFFFISIFLHVLAVWIIAFVLMITYDLLSKGYHLIFPKKEETPCT